MEFTIIHITLLALLFFGENQAMAKMLKQEKVQKSNNLPSFPLYPTMEKIDHEDILGFSGKTTLEIHWTSYGSSDDISKILDFYKKPAKLILKEDQKIHKYEFSFPGNPSKFLSIYSRQYAPTFFLGKTPMSPEIKTILIFSEKS